MHIRYLHNKICMVSEHTLWNGPGLGRRWIGTGYDTEAEAEKSKESMTERFDDIIKGNVPVLVDFSAEWCSPCKMLGPVLEQLKQKMAGRIRIVKIDVDRNRELAGRYRIQSVPTLILFQGGRTKWSGVGVMTSNFLENAINNNTDLISN